MEYAGIAGTASSGIQEGISGSMGFNVFVAVNNLAKNDLEMSPSTFEGVTESVGASIDFKAIAGLNVSGFSMTSGWTGGSIGASIGVGESFNTGSFFKGDSSSVLLNKEIPTAKRSVADRYMNNQYPIASGLASYITK